MNFEKIINNILKKAIKPYKMNRKRQKRSRGAERIRRQRYYRKNKPKIQRNQRRYRRFRKMQLKRRRQMPPHYKRVGKVEQPLKEQRDYGNLDQIEKNILDLIEEDKILKKIIGKEASGLAKHIRRRNNRIETKSQNLLEQEKEKGNYKKEVDLHE